MSLQAALTGISGILVTPFDEGDRIAPARLAPVSYTHLTLPTILRV